MKYNVILRDFLGVALISVLTECAQVTLQSGRIFTNQLGNEFDWNLGKAVNRVEQNNMAVSTISVKLVIGMLYLGALGRTAKEIEEVLKIKPLDKISTLQKFSNILHTLEATQKEYAFDIGTKIFIDKSAQPKPDFLAKLSEYFNSTTETVDFKQQTAALEAINSWANKVTHGRIQQLITAEDTKESTVMLLLNAIYFKGLWEKPFPPESTVPGVFTLLNGSQVQVPYMTMVDKFQYNTIPELDCKILRLPYMGKKFAMYIMLPNNRTGLRRVAEDITPGILEKAIKNFKEETVLIRMPKFHFESTVILGPLLAELGLREIFLPTADLSNIGISKEGPFAVSNVLQKAGLEVNEQGSIAYAATEAELVTRIRDPISAEFSMKHPFVFAITEESTRIMAFIGKVVNPLFAGKPVVSIPVVSESTDSKGPVAADVPVKQIVETPIVEGHHNERYSYFDTDLLQKLRRSNSENVVLSPESVKASLLMLLEGAKGKTAHELKEALRLPDDKNDARNLIRKHQLALKDKSPDITLEFQNKVFLTQNEKLSPQYSETIRTQYFSDVQQLNFSNPFMAASFINDWVKNTTKGLISSIVSPDGLDASTKLFLANCIYFKAEWLTAFDPLKTTATCFYNEGDLCLQANMMRLRSYFNYAMIKSLNAEAIEIPFKDSRYSMIVILPLKIDGLGALLKDIQRYPMANILLEFKSNEVDLLLPRFTIEYSTSLVPALKALDVKEIFSPTADLSGMLQSSKPLPVSDIIHKAKIEVNEKGAEAAAVTGAQVIMLSTTEPMTFKADHPFVFFIHDKMSGGFLFEGILSVPEVAEKDPTLKSPVDLKQRPEMISVDYSQIFQQPQPADKDGVHYPLRPSKTKHQGGGRSIQKENSSATKRL